MLFVLVTEWLIKWRHEATKIRGKRSEQTLGWIRKTAKQIIIFIFRCFSTNIYLTWCDDSPMDLHNCSNVPHYDNKRKNLTNWWRMKWKLNNRNLSYFIGSIFLYCFNAVDDELIIYLNDVLTFVNANQTHWQEDLLFSNIVSIRIPFVRFVIFNCLFLIGNGKEKQNCLVFFLF